MPGSLGADLPPPQCCTSHAGNSMAFPLDGKTRFGWTAAPGATLCLGAANRPMGVKVCAAYAGFVPMSTKKMVVGSSVGFRQACLVPFCTMMSPWCRTVVAEPRSSTICPLITTP